MIPSLTTVLVVDDDQQLLGLFRHYVAPYACAFAASAEEAVELLRAQPFQLVLTDMKLPGASGFEVCRFAREHCPDAVLLMMTGMDGGQHATKALQAGVFHFVTKPIDFPRLLLLVEDAVRHQALAARIRRRHTG